MGPVAGLVAVLSLLLHHSVLYISLPPPRQKPATMSLDQSEANLSWVWTNRKQSIMGLDQSQACYGRFWTNHRQATMRSGPIRSKLPLGLDYVAHNRNQLKKLCRDWSSWSIAFSLWPIRFIDSHKGKPRQGGRQKTVHYFTSDANKMVFKPV